MTKSHKTLILEHLQSGKTLTPLQAFGLWGKFYCGRRISELRRAGHNIVNLNKFGHAEYKLLLPGMVLINLKDMDYVAIAARTGQD